MENLREQLNREFSHLFENRGGFLDAMATYHFSSGGKRFRGLLSLMEGKELGVSMSDALKWGVACEVLHNATLVHDDIQDDDPLRRGQESAWIKFGRNQAINLGDYLIFMAYEALIDIESLQTLPELLRCLTQNAKEVVQGQTLELQMNSMEPNTLWQNYLEVASLKTGALLRAPIEGIHILSGKTFEVTRNLTEPWKRLGLVYQINDDINDFLGRKQDEQSLKDFYEQKINSIVAWLSMDENNKSLISDYLSCEKQSKEHKLIVQKLRDVVLASHTLAELNQVKDKFYNKFQSEVQGAAKGLMDRFLSFQTPKENHYNGPSLA